MVPPSALRWPRLLFFGTLLRSPPLTALKRQPAARWRWPLLKASRVYPRYWS